MLTVQQYDARSECERFDFDSTLRHRLFCLLEPFVTVRQKFPIAKVKIPRCSSCDPQRLNDLSL